MQRIAVGRRGLRLRAAQASDKRRSETPKDWLDELLEWYKNLSAGAVTGQSISDIIGRALSSTLLKWAVLALVFLKILPLLPHPVAVSQAVPPPDPLIETQTEILKEEQSTPPDPTAAATVPTQEGAIPAKVQAVQRSLESKGAQLPQASQSAPVRPDFSLSPSTSSPNPQPDTGPVPQRVLGNLPGGVPGVAGSIGTNRPASGGGAAFPGNGTDRSGSGAGEHDFLATCANWIPLQSALILEVEAFIKRTGSNRCIRDGTQYVIDRSTSRTNLHISANPPNKTSACSALDEFRKCIQ